MNLVRAIRFFVGPGRRILPIGFLALFAGVLLVVVSPVAATPVFALDNIDVVDIGVVIESIELDSGRNTAVVTLQTPQETDNYTVVWSPFPEEGQGESSATFSWRSAGEKTIYVTLVATDDSRATAQIIVDLSAGGTDQGADAQELEAASDQGVDIVGGEEAAVGAWPWQVALLADPNNGNTQFCGGSLIAADWVLTAAHCVDDWGPGTLYVVAGRHRLSSNEGETLPVSNIIVHPNWNSSTGDSDIALLKLSTSSSATPVSIDAIDYPPGTAATVTGWGLTIAGVSASASDVLMQVTLPVSSSAQCTAAYGSSITSAMFCAGQAGSDSCQGDSGGPLMVPGGSPGWTQIGIVSWGIGCGDVGYPGVYTTVSIFSDWIQQQMAGGGTDPEPGSAVPTYRFYCTWGDHFFTISDIEKNSIGAYCDYEGVGWNAFAGPAPGAVPVYRLFCNAAADHFYTTNEIERQIIAPHCSDEGIAFYAYPDQQPGTVPVYRLYCWWGDHFFTTNAEERDVIADICHYEGIGWYALPASGGTPPSGNITNGDFEQGVAGWNEYSAQIEPLIMSGANLLFPAHTGNWAAWLGGLNNEVSYISQIVTIPAATPYLNYWQWIHSSDACGYDYGGVGVNGEWFSPYDLCWSSNTDRWVPVSIDMSSFADQRIELDIIATTDISAASSLLIDDISFGASVLAGQTPMTPAADLDAVVAKDGAAVGGAGEDEKAPQPNVSPPPYR